MTKSQAKSGKTLLHWSQRQQQQQKQHQQQQQQRQHAQQLLSDKAAINDTLDVLEACGSHPQQSEWRRLWELASSRYFDRQHRVLWWRILHGSLMCGTYKACIHRGTPEQACCPFACCSRLSQPQTFVLALFLFFGRDGYSRHKCNDSNLKET